MSMFSPSSSNKRSDGYDAAGSSHGGNATVIARGVRVEGEFSSPGDVLIEGELLGQVTTGGLLTVGPEAKIKADVTAEQAVIAGTIEGNFNVKQRLELKSTAKLTGDLTCSAISVEVGATINGKVTIGNTKPEKAAAHTETVAAKTAEAASAA